MDVSTALTIITSAISHANVWVRAGEMTFARVVSHAAAMPTIDRTISGSSAGKNELRPPPVFEYAKKEPGNVPTHAEMSQRSFGSLNEMPGRIRIIMLSATGSR